jgi:hypothetical protein
LPQLVTDIPQQRCHVLVLIVADDRSVQHVECFRNRFGTLSLHSQDECLEAPWVRETGDLVAVAAMRTDSVNADGGECVFDAQTRFTGRFLNVTAGNLIEWDLGSNRKSG